MGLSSSKTCSTEEEAEAFIKETIKAHPVVIFSKFYCPYCIMATSAFKSINVNYHEVQIFGRSDCSLLQDVLLKMTGERTVPRVFIHETCIGGGSETNALLKEKKLKSLIENGKKEGTDQLN